MESESDCEAAKRPLSWPIGDVLGAGPAMPQTFESTALEFCYHSFLPGHREHGPYYHFQATANLVRR